MAMPRPLAILGGGVAQFLMIKILYSCSILEEGLSFPRRDYRDTSLIRHCPLPRATVGPGHGPTVGS